VGYPIPVRILSFEPELLTSRQQANRFAKAFLPGFYLEVLTTDTDLYDAQLQLAQSQEPEAASLVQLYAALGGGWQ
jgi:multidrug efflux system outer membrane protein